MHCKFKEENLYFKDISHLEVLFDQLNLSTKMKDFIGEVKDLEQFLEFVGNYVDTGKEMVIKELKKLCENNCFDFKLFYLTDISNKPIELKEISSGKPFLVKSICPRVKTFYINTGLANFKDYNDSLIWYIKSVGAMRGHIFEALFKKYIDEISKEVTLASHSFNFKAVKEFSIHS
jgi:hypothetical protein